MSLPTNHSSAYFGVFEGTVLSRELRGAVSAQVCQAGKHEDFLASNFPWYLVSNAVREAVQRASLKGIDFCDIGLDSAHPSLAGYTLMRPEFCLDLIDEDRSNIVWANVHGGRMVERWDNLILDRDKMKGVGELPDFFALVNFPFFGVVSHKMASVLTHAEFSGFSITGFQTASVK